MNDSAASSITNKLCFLATRNTISISKIDPKRDDTIIALVFEFTAFSNSSSLGNNVYWFISNGIGTNPWYLIIWAIYGMFIAVIITSEPVGYAKPRNSKSKTVLTDKVTNIRSCSRFLIKIFASYSSSTLRSVGLTNYFRFYISKSKFKSIYIAE